jgi:putative ABC transport system substrate-binding protein
VIDRRAFLFGIAGGLLAAPLAAEGQPAGRRVPLVGVLWLGEPSASVVLRAEEAFRQGLREHGGYVEGQNIAIESRYADLDGLPSAANDLVRLNVDVIVSGGGTPAALAAKRATTTIPIVARAMADPVADGLVANLARPGGNVTGNTFLAPELGPKRLQLLREIVPSVTRVAVLQHPGVYSERTMRGMLNGIRAAAVGLQLQVLDARGPNDFDTAFSAMAKARAVALIVFPSPMFYVNYRRLVDLAAKHRLADMYVFREAVEAGGLVCYGANLPDLSRRSAAYVDKILRGAKPADLPVEQPTTFDFAINLKTAKALGLTIPPSLLQRADQVIE